MSEERERESLPDETRAAIEEVRMVLPGMQALFGFQLIAVFNERFDQLSASLRLAHFGSLILVAIAIALVLEVGVISTIVLHSVLISALISTALALVFALCWFVFPFRVRQHHRRSRKAGSSAL